MKLNSVYVGVEEMDRALAFYRELFETEPSQVFLDTEGNRIEVFSTGSG